MVIYYAYYAILVVWLAIGVLFTFRPCFAARLLGAQAFALSIHQSPAKRRFRLRAVGVLMLIGCMVAWYYELSRSH